MKQYILSVLLCLLVLFGTLLLQASVIKVSIAPIEIKDNSNIWGQIAPIIGIVGIFIGLHFLNKKMNNLTKMMITIIGIIIFIFGIIGILETTLSNIVSLIVNIILTLFGISLITYLVNIRFLGFTKIIKRI